MAMTPYGGDPLVISKLGTTPQERGLTTEQFKAKFDEGLKEFVTWFNDTHKTEFDAHLADMAKQIIEMPFVSGIVGYSHISYAYKVYNTVSIFIRCKKEDGSVFVQGDTTLATLPAGYRPTSILGTSYRFLPAFYLTADGTTSVAGACIAYVASNGDVRVSMPSGVSNASRILIPEQSFEI